VSVLTLGGRLVVSSTGYARHVALLQQGREHGADLGTAKLWYDKPHKQFYLLISVTVELPNPTPETRQRLVGVDVGQRYLAVATDTQNKTLFFAGKEVRAQADHSARLRKRLQHKGTRSAARRLIAVSGRERRLKQQHDHHISRRLVERYPNSLIGLEDLTHIRERSKHFHRKRRDGKQTSGKQRKANRHASSWAFAELRAYLAYKAALAGSLTIRVDAYHTSQACPSCGYTSPNNRPGKGLLFMCQNLVCQLVLHADLIGARNIGLRTQLAWQDWATSGVLSERPDVSDDEAKAVRRQRYAEVRWSPDASSTASAGSI
jgi:putative transposase